MLALDHIVIAAPSLAAGTAHVRDQTGIDMPKGGEHPLMGTHNHLVRMGADEFLEVIAVNPEAPAPQRPRWFNLDQPVQRPRLSHWVVRCTDMEATRPLFPDTHGPAIPVTRGDLRWLLTVPEDGSLPLDGVAPSLIDWQTAPLPPTRMPGADAALTALELHHPQAKTLAHWLEPLLPDPRISYHTGPVGIKAQLTVRGCSVTLR
ncbi:VOC family protein [Pseudooceanicola nitratireducens]|uniref:VOC family protein n=1 Tax=Pseudooceanicola nitratireducens TaxID=517719 RepID=UPI001C94B8AB|nr:VOC family protein [Pseudooceanicola nitratireducens]MBY6164325.1 VOC family protein [Pseudooceanicola nitratireducens]